MAAGLKQAAGLGEVPLRATNQGDGLSISGPIRWASNVFPDALMVVPACGRMAPPMWWPSKSARMEYASSGPLT